MRSDLEGHILDLHATAMAAAIIRTCGTGASLTLIAREAFALASLTVADAPVGALRVLVVVAQLIRGIYPRELERTDPLRAVTAVMAKADSPVVKTLAHTVLPTCTMARTSIVAARSFDRRYSEKRKRGKHRHHPRSNHDI